MKNRMTHIGIGIAALAALAAEGKDFDRDELNAMLDRLAASPEPEIRRGPHATCYKMAVPRPERFEYVCTKCGTHTVYPANRRQMANTLERFRDDAANLRALGLDIVLDESALCQKCNPFTQECWISSKSISETGELLGDDVIIRSAPGPDSPVLRRVSRYELFDYRESKEGAGDKGVSLRRLPARPGDPAEWVRLDPSICGFDRILNLAWIINGKRTVVDRGDVELLEKFMKGEVYLRDGSDGDSVSMKSQLPRLRELLGEPKK